jgi:hypothetical protein
MSRLFVRLMRRLAPAAALLISALAAPASAHHLRTTPGAPVQGLRIPGLTHGQMAAIAAHRPEILKLAAEQTPTDPTLRRLQGYVALQTFACLWGLAPGAIEDESSPFNECSHAYLAGTKALLMHLLTLPGERAPAVRALADRIELDMMQNNASLVLCRFSDEPFDSAELIGPNWSAIPFHPASLLALASVLFAGIGCVWLAVRFRP